MTKTLEERIKAAGLNFISYNGVIDKTSINLWQVAAIIEALQAENKEILAILKEVGADWALGKHQNLKDK